MKKKKTIKTKIKIPQTLLGEKIEKMAEWIEQKYPAVSNAVAIALRVKFRAGMVIHWKGATSVERSYSIGYNALFNLMKDWGVLIEDVPELEQNKQFKNFYKKKIELLNKHLVIDLQNSIQKNKEVKDKVKQKDKLPS